MKERMRAQGFTNWEILEEHTCIYTVSDREIELQRQYDLPVDTIPYWKKVQQNKSIEQRAKISAALTGIKRNPTFEHQSKAAKAAHLSKLEKGTYIEIGKKKRKLSKESILDIRKKEMGQRDYATKYNVSQRTITMIQKRITYKEIC
ncbi:MAG: hypothetical protein GY694_20945 [Gammaproteobacteria bacterium]|nr:hypothetical protein [Gammaproteobacteria bacterium]